MGTGSPAPAHRVLVPARIRAGLDGVSSADAGRDSGAGRGRTAARPAPAPVSYCPVYVTFQITLDPGVWKKGEGIE
jgi:hypothetical protein